MMLIIILSFIIVSILFLLLTKEFAKQGYFFVEPKEGEIITVVKGESFSKFILTLDGFTIDSNHNIVPGNRERGVLESLIGVMWIGFWPWWTILKFKVNVDKIKEGIELKGGESTNLGNLILHSEKREVQSLLVKIPRPVFVDNAELPGDNAQIDVILRVVVRVVNPYKFLFVHKANVALMEEAIEGAFNNYCQKAQLPAANGATEQLSYRSWLKLDKQKGSDLIQSLFFVNNQAMNAPLGTVEQYGLELQEAYVVGFEPDESTKKIADALRKEEAAKATAKETIAQAHGVAESIIIKAKAEAEKIRLAATAESEGANLNVNAVKDHPYGMNYLTAREFQKAATGTRSTVFAPGGSAFPMVPVSTPPQNPEENGDSDKKDQPK